MLIDGTELFSRHVRLHRRHAQVETLCVLLEQIADDLPRPDASDCLTAIGGLEEFIAARNDLASLLVEDNLLRSRAVGHRTAKRMIVQWQEEEGLAQELIEELRYIDPDATTHSMNCLGYMLRAFFTNCRRSMLVEELAVRLPEA